MKREIPYPYTLEQKENILRLIIDPKNSRQLLYLCCTILFSALFIFHIVMIGLIIPTTDFTLEFILISGIVLSLEIFMILYFFSSYWWKRKGQEIFILYPNSLEYIQTGKNG